MKPAHLLSNGIIFLICIFSAIYLISCNNTTNKDTKIIKTSNGNKTKIQLAIEEFKNNPGFRNEPAKILVPLLKIGMTKDDVESLLGKPDEISDLTSCTKWYYGLFYSEYIDIQFDSDDKANKIQACAPGLGNDQSGSYLLEKNNTRTKSLFGTWIKESASMEGADYPGDKDWELNVTFYENARFTWDSKRKDQNGDIIDESLNGTYSTEQGFMINYHFDKPSDQAMKAINKLFSFWPSQTLGQQVYSVQGNYLRLSYSEGRLSIRLKKI